MDWSAFWLSIRVAFFSLLLVTIPGILTGWWLAHGRGFRGKFLVETVCTLPLVLPPTGAGYLLLLLLGNGTPVGRWLNHSLHLHLIFTWQGAAVAAAVVSFPLFLRAAASAFASLDVELLEAGRSLGASEAVLLWKVGLPLGRKGLISGAALSLGRALGEFGATIMVAGNIEGVTRTMPLALYTEALAGNNHKAILLLICMLWLAFLLLGAADVLATHRRGENRTVRNRVEEQRKQVYS